MSELRTLIEISSTAAEKLFRRDGHIHRPLWLAFKATGEAMFIPAELPSSKDLQMAMIRALFELENVVRYVQVMEAWTLHENVSEEELARLKAHYKKRGIADHPNRREVLHFTAEDHIEGLMVADRAIVRGGGKPRLGPLEFKPYRHSEGRMIGLLPVKQRAN